MKTHIAKISKQEHGFVLITAMVFLIALTLLGILAADSSIFERTLSVNERMQMDTFYNADSGINAAIGLIGMNDEFKGFSNDEENAMRGIGFDVAYAATYESSFYFTPDQTLQTFRGAPADLNLDGAIDTIDDGIFFSQNALGQNGTIYSDAFLPRRQADDSRYGHTTSIKIDPLPSTLADGTGHQTSEEYHGLGSVSTGGAQIVYDIRSRCDSVHNTAEQVYVQFQRIIK